MLYYTGPECGECQPTSPAPEEPRVVMFARSPFPTAPVGAGGEGGGKRGRELRGQRSRP